MSTCIVNLWGENGDKEQLNSPNFTLASTLSLWARVHDDVGDPLCTKIARDSYYCFFLKESL